MQPMSVLAPISIPLAPLSLFASPFSDPAAPLDAAAAYTGADLDAKDRRPWRPPLCRRRQIRRRLPRDHQPRLGLTLAYVGWCRDQAAAMGMGGGDFDRAFWQLDDQRYGPGREATKCAA